MNVIDGQPGLIIYSSLIFYSLTINNILNIIILLILAGISISALTKENGLWTQANNAKDKSQKSQVEEEVKLAVMTLQIEENQKEMTQEEKRKFLEDEFKKQETDSTVDIIGKGFLANYSGYEVKIDKEYNVSVKEPFNAEEWDKTAAEESVFFWGSDDPNDEGYGVVVGYTSNVQNYTVLRYPSRCTKISLDVSDYTYKYSFVESDSNRIYLGDRSITSNIKKVELPETITEIGYFAFSGESMGGYNFTSLTNIEIPDGVTKIGKQAFFHCSSLTSVMIPDSVTSIGNEAFRYCCYLTNVVIPDSVTSIGDLAFYMCTGLSDIIIPDSVTSIGNNAFSGVPHIYYNGTATGSPWGAEAIN